MEAVAALPMVEHCDLWLDDVSLDVTGDDPVQVASAALRAYRTLHECLQLEGLEVSASKTKFVTSTTRAKSALNSLRRETEPEVANIVKDLGLDNAGCKRRRIQPAAKRFKVGLVRRKQLGNYAIRVVLTPCRLFKYSPHQTVELGFGVEALRLNSGLRAS